MKIQDFIPWGISNLKGVMQTSVLKSFQEDVDQMFIFPET